MTKCADCLTGKKRIDKFRAQLAAVAALPPLASVPGAVALRVPGVPMAWNNALVRGRGRPYLRPEAKEWKAAVALAAAQARPLDWSLSGYFVVELVSVFVSDRSDADGPVKLAVDALQGVVYANDRQVMRVSASKLVDAAAPRLEMTVRRIL